MRRRQASHHVIKAEFLAKRAIKNGDASLWEKNFKAFRNALEYRHVNYFEKLLIAETHKQIKQSEKAGEFVESRSVPLLEGLVALCKLPKRYKLEPYLRGMVIIDGKYIVSPRSRRWRVSGSEKWYWYRDVKDFYEKYLRPKNTKYVA